MIRIDLPEDAMCDNDVKVCRYLRRPLHSYRQAMLERMIQAPGESSVGSATDNPAREGGNNESVSRWENPK